MKAGELKKLLREVPNHFEVECDGLAIIKHSFAYYDRNTNNLHFAADGSRHKRANMLLLQTTKTVQTVNQSGLIH